MNKANVFEIRIKGVWRKTSEDLFRAWGGERRLDGEDYTGPVFKLGTDDVAREGTAPNRCRLLADMDRS